MRGRAGGRGKVPRAPADVVLVSERLSPCPEATAKPDLEFNSTSRPST